MPRQGQDGPHKLLDQRCEIIITEFIRAQAGKACALFLQKTNFYFWENINFHIRYSVYNIINLLNFDILNCKFIKRYVQSYTW